MQRHKQEGKAGRRYPPPVPTPHPHANINQPVETMSYEFRDSYFIRKSVPHHD